ncbi:acyltransferase family protein [Intestinibacter sp.]
MKTVINKRLEYLDIAKGFAILLVVLGHIYDMSNPIKIWIYSFHMPLFFVISGILCNHTNQKERTISNVIISKFKSLIIPYIFFELLAIFISMIQNDFTFDAFKINIINSIFMYCKAGATWFLPCLFVAEVVFIFMVKYVENNKLCWLFSALIFLIPFSIEANHQYIIVPLRCFTAFGFISFGYYMYNIVIEKELSFPILIVLLTLNIVLGELNRCVDLWSLGFNNIFLYIASALFGTLFIIFSFKKIKGNIILEYLGTNTIIIMSTQQVILGIISKFIGVQFYDYLRGILIFIIAIIIEIPVIYIINNYMPWMLGKFKKKEKIQVISD